jgi:hypothetical protein
MSAINILKEMIFYSISETSHLYISKNWEQPLSVITLNSIIFQYFSTSVKHSNPIVPSVSRIFLLLVPECPENTKGLDQYLFVQFEIN